MRTLVFALVAVAVSVLVIFALTPPVEVEATSTFLAATNAAREARGLPPLKWRDGLASASKDHSRVMRSVGYLFHTVDLGGNVCCWEVVGENVARGPNKETIFASWMASPDHRANILDPDYTRVGYGYVRDDSGRIWVTATFKKPN